ncbi:hypothetical protein ACMA5I_07330 [Paracoccaceae bacterium GXU_MW_L88]
MTRNLISRRKYLSLLGALIFTLTTGVALTDRAVAQTALDATLVSANGEAIPEGEIVIVFEGAESELQSRRAAPAMRFKSEGGAKAVKVSLPAVPSGENVQIVARLERADGWLLARGSAKLRGDGPVEVMLHQVMY